ncbi:hypothetical protein Peur_035707 [Populus x canadensis]
MVVGVAKNHMPKFCMLSTRQQGRLPLSFYSPRDLPPKRSRTSSVLLPSFSGMMILHDPAIRSMDPLPSSVHTTTEPFLEPLAIIGPSVYACLLSPVDSLYHTREHAGSFIPFS